MTTTGTAISTPASTANLTFQVERYADTIEEAKPLLTRHWDEIARNKDIVPLDPDYPRYDLLEKHGKLRAFTIRDSGQLAGYAVYIVDTHLHYRTIKWAISDIFWTDPAVRATPAIIWLLRFVERELAKERPIVMHTTYKDAHPGPGIVLAKLGHTLIEHGYAKVL